MGPFERHLVDAIALNRERAPRYSGASGGASRVVSRTLIGAELLLIPVARWYDRRAAPYHRAGVPLLEDLFVSMDGAPRYGAAFVVGDPPPAAAEVRVIRVRIWQAFRTTGFAGAAVEVEHSLGRLAQRGGSYLLRHLLESALRLTVLAPVRIRESDVRVLPSPAPLLTSLLRMHLRGLRFAAALDRRAHVLHRRGIGILVNDLPAIPRD